MTVDLLNLPNEILILIVSHLHAASSTAPTDAITVSKPELCALALTCRRFSSLTREHIFGCVALKHHNLSLWAIYSQGGSSYSYCNTIRRDGDRIKLLMRTWDQNQSLLLWGLQRVTWHTEYFDPSIREEFFDYLARSESLVELSLLSCSREDVRRLAVRIHSPARQSYFSKLQNLRIRPIDPTAIYSGLLSGLCTAPTLRELDVLAHSISVHDFDEMSGSPYIKDGNPSTIVLQSLRIGSGSHVDIAAFKCILSQCTNMKQLSCPPPGPGIAFEHSGWRPYPENNGRKFSSALVSQALLPVSNTLEDLSITDPDVVFTAHDQSRLDLSAFNVLRKLRISSVVLTGARHLCHPGKPSNGAIWKLLPPNLEELHVAFDSLDGLFYGMESLEIIPEYPNYLAYSNLWSNGPGSEQKVAQALSWVTEIAHRKRSGQVMSQLRMIDLVECHISRFLRQNAVGFGLKISSLRSAHLRLFQTFEKAGIMVDLKIYVPNE